MGRFPEPFLQHSAAKEPPEIFAKRLERNFDQIDEDLAGLETGNTLPADLVTSDETSLKTIRGVVTLAAGGGGTATINEGTGFTASRLGAGQLRVTFDTAFSDAPAVTATSDWHGTSLGTTNNADQAEINAWDLTAAPALADGVIHFHIIGPA